jgi:hypothetical protein
MMEINIHEDLHHGGDVSIDNNKGKNHGLGLCSSALEVHAMKQETR